MGKARERCGNHLCRARSCGVGHLRNLGNLDPCLIHDWAGDEWVTDGDYDFEIDGAVIFAPRSCVCDVLWKVEKRESAFPLLDGANDLGFDGLETGQE